MESHQATDDEGHVLFRRATPAAAEKAAALHSNSLPLDILSENSHRAATSMPKVFDPSPVREDHPAASWKADQGTDGLLGPGDGLGSCDPRAGTAARAQSVAGSEAGQLSVLPAEVMRGDFTCPAVSAASQSVDTTLSMSCRHVNLPGEEFLLQQRQSGESAAPPIELIPHPVVAIAAILPDPESPMSFGSFQVGPIGERDHMGAIAVPNPSPLSFASYQGAGQECSGGPDLLAMGTETPLSKPEHSSDSSSAQDVEPKGALLALDASRPSRARQLSSDSASPGSDAGPQIASAESGPRAAFVEGQPTSLQGGPNGQKPHRRDGGVAHPNQEDDSPSTTSDVDWDMKGAQVQGGGFARGEQSGALHGNVPGNLVSKVLQDPRVDTGKGDVAELPLQQPLPDESSGAQLDQGSVQSLDAQIADALFDASGTSLPPGFSRAPISMSDSWAGNADRVEMGSPLKGTTAGSDDWSKPLQGRSHLGLETVASTARAPSWEALSQHGGQQGGASGEGAMLTVQHLCNSPLTSEDVDRMIGRLTGELRLEAQPPDPSTFGAEPAGNPVNPVQDAHVSRLPPTLSNSHTLGMSSSHITSQSVPHTVPSNAAGDSASTDLAATGFGAQTLSEYPGFYASQIIPESSGEFLPPLSFPASFPRSTCDSQVSLDAVQNVADAQTHVNPSDRVPGSTRSSVVGRASWVQELLDGRSRGGSQQGDNAWLAKNCLSSSLRKTGLGSGSYMALQHHAESRSKTVQPRVVQQYMLPTQSSLQHAHSLGVSCLSASPTLRRSRSPSLSPVAAQQLRRSIMRAANAAQPDEAAMTQRPGIATASTSLQASSPQTKKRIAAVEAFVSYAKQFSLLCDDGRGGKDMQRFDKRDVMGDHTSSPKRSQQADAVRQDAGPHSLSVPRPRSGSHKSPDQRPAWLSQTAPGSKSSQWKPATVKGEQQGLRRLHSQPSGWPSALASEPVHPASPRPKTAHMQSLSSPQDCRPCSQAGGPSRSSPLRSSSSPNRSGLGFQAEGQSPRGRKPLGNSNWGTPPAIPSGEERPPWQAPSRRDGKGGAAVHVPRGSLGTAKSSGTAGPPMSRGASLHQQPTIARSLQEIESQGVRIFTGKAIKRIGLDQPMPGTHGLLGKPYGPSIPMSPRSLRGPPCGTSRQQIGQAGAARILKGASSQLAGPPAPRRNLLSPPSTGLQGRTRPRMTGSPNTEPPAQSSPKWSPRLAERQDRGGGELAHTPSGVILERRLSALTVPCAHELPMSRSLVASDQGSILSEADDYSAAGVLSVPDERDQPNTNSRAHDRGCSPVSDSPASRHARTTSQGVGEGHVDEKELHQDSSRSSISGGEEVAAATSGLNHSMQTQPVRAPSLRKRNGKAFVRLICRLKPSVGGSFLSLTEPSTLTAELGNHVADTRSYQFDDVIPAVTSNRKLASTCRDIIESVAAEKNTAVLAFGHSGSGKTHNLLGSLDPVTGRRHRGLMALLGAELLSQLQPDWKMHMTAFETRDEQIVDLLGQPAEGGSMHRKQHDVIRDKAGCCWVTHLECCRLEQSKDLESVLHAVAQRRSVCSPPDSHGPASLVVTLIITRPAMNGARQGTKVPMTTTKVTFAEVSGGTNDSLPSTLAGRLGSLTLSHRLSMLSGTSGGHHMAGQGKPMQGLRDGPGTVKRRGGGLGSARLEMWAMGEVLWAAGHGHGTPVPYRLCKLTRYLQDTLHTGGCIVALLCVDPSKGAGIASLPTLTLGSRIMGQT